MIPYVIKRLMICSDLLGAVIVKLGRTPGAIHSSRDLSPENCLRSFLVFLVASGGGSLIRHPAGGEPWLVRAWLVRQASGLPGHRDNLPEPFKGRDDNVNQTHLSSL